MSKIYMDQMLWPNGKKKALTFSYDDGNDQDRRLVRMFQEKNVKATYNINPGLFGDQNEVELDGVMFSHNVPERDVVQALYAGEDVAAHGWHHIFLSGKDPARCVHEILDSRRALEEMFGKVITGYAYAFGDCSPAIRDMASSCGIRYARTIRDTHSFKIPEDFLFWDPTCHHNDPELFSLAEKFLSDYFSVLEPISRLMYVWGHSYEFDQYDNWSRMEEFLELVSGREDVWYASNSEIYRYVQAYRQLIFSTDSKFVFNPTSETIWLGGLLSDRVTEVRPGYTVATGEFIDV